ncbi:NAD(P)-dependent alcohol dehydrogenase [bacterium]|nr:NAD(P)-dependent alcohol dehydrogenase [bacterium]
MKAITYRQYGSPEVLFLGSRAQPIPKANEVLIRVRAAAVSQVDSQARRGRPFAIRLAVGLVAPRIQVLGTEFAGEVEQVGQTVTGYKPGDLVYGGTGDRFGAHAEYICLPEDGALARKPATVDFAEAAAICEGALTALPFLRDEAHLQPGQRVLINGASGSVGTAAVQLAKHLGADVTGVCSTGKLELVRSLGANQVIDYTQEDFTTAGQTYDVVFDAVGKSSFVQCRPVLNPTGVYLSTVLALPILWQTLFSARSRGQRAKLALTGLRPERDKAQDLVLIRELVEAGKLQPVIDRRFPLEQFAAAHRLVDSGHKTGSAILNLAASTY